MQTHHVRKLTFSATAADMTVAAPLRARLEAFSRERAPSVLSRVLDACGGDGKLYFFDKIDLDLGRLPTLGFEAAAEAALEEALGAALGRALSGLRKDSASDGLPAIGRSESAARRDAFATYLSTGTLPFWADGPEYTFSALLPCLLREDPAALRVLLRQMPRYGLRRLVLQADMSALAKLLALLAPGDDAVILAYIADLLTISRREPVLPLTVPRLERMLWEVTLVYLLHEAGSQFNRRRYLERLLRGIARQERIAYGLLLQSFAAALERTREHVSLGSSLPAVLAELIAEQATTTDEIVLPDPGAGSSPEDFLSVLKRLATDPAELERYLRRFSPDAFAALIRRLAPAEAETALEYLTELLAAHRYEPLLALSAQAFETRMRLLTVLYFVRNAGTQFNRRRFLESLLRNAAESERVPYDVLLDVLEAALSGMERRTAISISLAAVVAELIAERKKTQSFKADNRVNKSPDTESAFGIVRRLAVNPDALHRHLMGWTASEFENFVRRIVPENPDMVPDVLGMLVSVFGTAPQMRMAAPDFESWLRVFAMRHLLEAGGARPDRDSFIKWLICDIAGLVQANFNDVLEDFRRASAQMTGSVSSEDVHSVPTDKLPEDTLARVLKAGNPSDRYAADPLRERILQFLRFPETLLKFLAVLTPEEFSDLLHRLEPVHAALMLACLEDLAGTHRHSPIVFLSGEAFEALLRMLGVLYTVQNAGTQFNRRSYLRRILEGIAEREGVKYSAVLEIASQSLTVTSRRMRLSDSLPAVIAELVAAEETYEESVVSDPDPETDDLYARLRTALADPDAGRMHPVPPEIRAGLTACDVGTLSAILSELAKEPSLLLRFAEWVPGSVRQTCLTAMFGANASWVAEVSVVMKSMLASIPLGSVSASRIDAYIWRQIFRYAAGRQGAADRQELLRRVLLGVCGECSVDTNAEKVLYALALSLKTRSPSTQTEKNVCDMIAGMANDLKSFPCTDLHTDGDDIYNDADMAKVLDWLSGMHASNPEEQAQLIRLCTDMLRVGDRRLLSALRVLAGCDRIRSLWASSLPELFLERLAFALAPERVRFVLSLMSFLQTAVCSLSGELSRTFRWRLSFSLLSGATPRSRRAIAGTLARTVFDLVPDGAGAVFAQGALLARNAGAHAHEELLMLARTFAETGDDMPDEANDRVSTAGSEDALYVDNAGLVLFSPFLPMLFERLDVLHEASDGSVRIAGGNAATRAVQALQYLATGRTDAPEPELALNKILCGIGTEYPIGTNADLSDEDRRLCDGLVDAVLNKWTAIDKTSRAGLRETFLLREGRILRSVDGWELTVQRKTVDFLVDAVPWSFHTICHRWMGKPLTIVW